MMTTRFAFALATLALTAAPALAGDAYGELGPRHAAVPICDDPAPAKTGLDSAQVEKVVKAHLDELEYCWNRLPAKQRVDATAMLKLDVAASGAVGGAQVTGALVPASARSCMAGAAQHWVFPASDIENHVEYGVVLRHE